MTQRTLVNNNDIIEIKEVLKKFQEGYTKRDSKVVDSYIKELFVNDDSVVTLGTNDSEWCLGLEEVKGIFKSDWEYWGDFVVDYEKARINSKGNVAWFIVDSALTYDYQDENVDEMNEYLKDCYFGEKGEFANAKPLSKLGKINWMMTFLMKSMQGKKDREYTSPVRLSGVLIKENNQWLISRLQFSMPMSSYPEFRIDKNSRESMKEYDKAKDKRNKFNEKYSGEHREVILELLEELQSNYLNKKVKAKEVVDNIFMSYEDIYVVDPNQNPAAIGSENIEKIILEQREKWEEITLDIDEAIISTEGDIVSIFTSGVFKKNLNADKLLSKELDNIKKIFEKEGKGEEKIFEIQKKIAYTFREFSLGEECLWPFRLQVLVVKENNQWKFHNLQFTYPTDWVFEGNYNMTSLL